MGNDGRRMRVEIEDNGRYDIAIRQHWTRCDSACRGYFDDGDPADAERVYTTAAHLAALAVSPRSAATGDADGIRGQQGDTA